MSNQAAGVTVGNASKIAADLVQLHLTTGVELDAVIGLWASTADTVIGEMAQHQNDNPPAAPQAPSGGVQGVPPAVAHHFPGTTVEQQAPAPQPQVSPGQTIVPPPAAAPQPQQQQGGQVVPFPGAGPAPIPGAQAQGGADPKLEEAWQVFFQDVQNGTFAQNWEDNRQQKAQGGKYAKIPDFKHKSWQRPGEQYPVGLYINDKKAPAWVAGALQQIGIS